MFKLDDEKALLESFRTRDRKHVELPADLKFPIILRDYVAWAHPSGGRLYLVFAPAEGHPTGVVFDTNGGGGQVPQLCAWCHSSAGAGGVAMLTATASNKKRVGVWVCGDLSCKAKVEEACNLAGRPLHDALATLVARMSQFAAEALRIDLLRR